jgi:hypothetical protein
MFPPKVNGISKKKCILRHGDNIVIGDRSFLFQQSSSRMLYSSPAGLHCKRSLQGSRATLSYMNSPSRSGTPTSSSKTSGSVYESNGVRIETDVKFHEFSKHASSDEANRVLSRQTTEYELPKASPSSVTSSMLRAMRKDTASLLPDGRPSMDTMTAQVRTQSYFYFILFYL